MVCIKIRNDVLSVLIERLLMGCKESNKTKNKTVGPNSRDRTSG